MANERVSPFHCPGPEMVNRNLLDNAYFLRPVNQRGESKYTLTGSGYRMDRWVIGKNVIVELGTDGMKLTHKDASDRSYNMVAQKQNPETVDFLLGKTVTISALFKNGTIGVGRVQKATAEATAGEEPQLVSYTYIYDAERDGAWSKYYPAIVCSNSGSGGTVIAAKLELGPTQTLAHLDSTGKWVLNEIPNYVEELNKCRYYYRVFDTEAQRTANNWGMRLANPVQGTISIDGATKYTLDANL